MSPVDEAAKLTENAYKTIMEQYNPCLRNFIAMGKCYEKALSGVTHAAKGYFDALVKLGEIGSESQASKELGDTVFQMAEVHRQIQIQAEEAIKSLHTELLSKLEQKLDQDAKYVSLTLKRYQVEYRAFSDGVEKVKAELKRMSKKSNKNPEKYREREVQVFNHMQVRSAELQQFVSDGYRNALVEERRRYCFLVDRHCAVTQIFAQCHGKAKELMMHKMTSWQTCCMSPSTLPPRVSVIFKHLQASPMDAGPGDASGARSGSSAMSPGPPAGGLPPPFISAPVPSEATMPMPPELAPFITSGRKPEPRSTIRRELPAVPNGGIPPPVATHGRTDSLGGGSSSGSTGSIDEDFGAQGGRARAGTGDRRGLPRPPASQPNAAAQQAPDLQYRTLPAKRTQHASGGGDGGGGGGRTRSGGSAVGPQLARSSSASGGLESAGAGGGPSEAVSTRVEALFQHIAGTQEGTLLSFEAGDVIIVLAPQPQDGWQYGENEHTSRRGWFPMTYTRPLDADDDSHSSHGEPDTLSSAGSLHDGDVPLPVADYFAPSPYGPESQGGVQKDDPNDSALRENPFYSIRLKPTVTNDRSAPHM